MNDYFDALETGLRDAVRRRAHLPWHARIWQLSVRHRWVAGLAAAFVIGTPTVAALGAVSGWFSQGKPDEFYAGSPTSGLGRAVKGSRMLAIRVPDPNGGPPWGLRLVETSRGDTCLQVGRVVDGKIGTLGIDGAWGNDHRFHEIEPGDGSADICGATDADGHGYVNVSEHGVPASADANNDYATGAAADYCESPFNGAVAPPWHGAIGRRRPHIPVCPKGSERMIFVGLLGPDARSVVYKTPSGATESQRTVGGVGAYLVVFKEDKANCLDFTRTAIGGSVGCESDISGGRGGTGLAGPSAVTSVKYANGRSCSDQPSAELLAAYKRFIARLRRLPRTKASRARVRRLQRQFMQQQRLHGRSPLFALIPQCPLVGWVAGRGRPVTASDVAAPVRLTVVQAKRYCFPRADAGKADTGDGDMIACDHGVPKGYEIFHQYAKRGKNGRMVPIEGPPTALVRISFTARRAVTGSQSWYECSIQSPGNHGGQGDQTDSDIRVGQQVTFTEFVQVSWRGTYTGAIGFYDNAGRQGLNGGDDPARDGSALVGRFSFKEPLRR